MYRIGDAQSIETGDYFSEVDVPIYVLLNINPVKKWGKRIGNTYYIIDRTRGVPVYQWIVKDVAQYWVGV